MKIFAIADLHLSFSENIDKPMGIFGSGWENHEERLREAWLSSVSENDLVLIPGDISWALKMEDALVDFEWIHELPGTKIISKGNHDLWWSRINYLNSLYDDIIFLQNECYDIEGENLVVVASRGWPYPGSIEYTEHDEKIYERELHRLTLGLESARSKAPGKKIIACLHYPPSDSFGRKTAFTEILENYNVWKCIYGHLHGQASFGSGIKGEHRGVEYILASLDYLGATPRLILDTADL